MDADGTLMEKEGKPFASEGYQLMGAAFEVHRELGGGLLEEIYHEAFALELGFRNIPFESHAVIPTFYKGRELKKRYIPDLIVSGSIVVEIKSVSVLAPEHQAQLLNYLRLTRHPVGYLINFAPTRKLEWQRLILSEFSH